MTNSMMLAGQWASRPDDQRFLTLEDLHAATIRRKDTSYTSQVELKDVQVLPEPNNRLSLAFDRMATNRTETVEPTHWSFGQMASLTGAPASWLRRVPSALAAINLQYGIENTASRDNSLLLVDGSTNQLRAITSTTYGRIWDHEVVEAVQRMNEAHGGRWKIPSASYATRNPKRASTLYASDRDVWMFLVDEAHPIDVEGEVLYRGFAVSNSEVGGGTLWMTQFLYRTICDNRIIWGMKDQKQISIKHTRAAPERFVQEVAPALLAYSDASDRSVISMVQQAKETRITESSKPDAVNDWLRARGFTASLAKQVESAAQAEEGQVRSLWDIVQGITAHARSVAHQDDRIDMELRANKILVSMN